MSSEWVQNANTAGAMRDLIQTWDEGKDDVKKLSYFGDPLKRVKTWHKRWKLGALTSGLGVALAKPISTMQQAF
jgi:hypothetical protein